MAYYDDNFGAYNIDSPEDVEFYHKVQKESKWKTCVICGEKVKLRPQYDKCNACCERMEQGGGW